MKSEWTKTVYKNANWEIKWIKWQGKHLRLQVDHGMHSQYPTYHKGRVSWDEPEQVPKYIKEIVWDILTAHADDGYPGA